MKALEKICITLISLLVTDFAFSQTSCAPTTAQADLDINNVRTTILVGGDMWWDLTSAKYEIPKGSNKHSLYAGSLWIGGIDAGGQIKVAAQTYRQNGTDFWGGPIDTVQIDITASKCLQYDRHWKVSKTEVQDFINDPTTATNDIKSWPGNGDPTSNEGTYLAPYVDVNGDGTYDYTDGDYPGYNFSGQYPNSPGTTKTVCNDYIFGDQTIWWVFNDVGNIHGTGSDPIGLEIRAQAFAFQTNDEINNMTFYKYQIINRSTNTLTQTYFGQWVDPDLGYSDDDYVGCDVGRGLGFCYNGDADDETATGYGMNPPAVGIDFFQGPLADIKDSIDNDKDGCVDCTFITDSVGVVSVVPDNILREQIIMSKFVYYDNVNSSPLGNPNGYTDFYNYLRGYWLDNQPITFGGNGRDPGNPVCNYMYPGDTDPMFPGQNWTEATANNPVGDRRFIQSAGVFTLEPGAVNYITTGVVWARATTGGPQASISLIKSADDKAQALFDNCFKLIDGPNAPDLAVRELDKAIILTLTNTNVPETEQYVAKDPTITGFPDSLTYFKFQGYQIFQFKDETVTVADIGNPDKVRLAAQCDVKDGIAQLVNFYYEPTLNANMPVEQVNGSDKGINHTFLIKQDLFATGNTALINHKTYYFTVVAYAHNNYKQYDPSDPFQLDGQKKPYLSGRNNIKTYTAIPHIPVVENVGTVLNSQFGDGPKIKRIEGSGNGGMIVDFDDETVNEIVTPPYYRSFQPVYKALKAPVKVKVFDPMIIDPLQYEIRFDTVSQVANYTLSTSDQSLVINSDYNIATPDELVVPEWGLTFQASSCIEPGDTLDPKNGYLESSIEFKNEAAKWLEGVADVDNIGGDPNDWIRSGTSSNDPYLKVDDKEVYENVVNGTWAPYKLVSRDPFHPRLANLGEVNISLSPNATTNTAINSIDVVFTPDQTKWTRCAVVETGNISAVNIGNAKQFDLRKSPSIGKNGEPDNSVSATGMSWFPGYAYDVETGVRLNIIFGENSSLTDDNSQDMKFNPSSRIYDSSGKIVLGGMHFIYIMGHNGDGENDVPPYDSCRYIFTKLNTLNSTDKRTVWKHAMWTNIPLVNSEFESLNLPVEIPTDVKVRIRIARNYRPFAGSTELRFTDDLSIGTTYYVSQPPVTHNGITYEHAGQSFIATTSQLEGPGRVTDQVPANNFMPLFTFGTENLASETNNMEVASEALRLVNVVPNPYYAYSSYESNQLDNRIKITNLPADCKVTILSQNGTVIRKFSRDVPTDNSAGTVLSPKSINTDTTIDWDLKNQKGIPVSSGMYLIHIDAGELGTKTIKWFGILRPIDLDTF
ncbi:MAG: hypothetical protein JNL49_03480 [Bacteroidia bacterium]|nr:hypothetical protein [Bacteroidia bacterium]